jgi:asparagine synthase (glutamine-hydrolysing)
VANFLIVVDPDPGRRAAFCKLARPRIAPLDHLVGGECVSADFAALWAGGPQAPIAQAGSGRSATVIWGAPMTEGDGRRLTPEQLADQWTASRNFPPPAFDGYFAAAVYDAHEGLVVGADILGLYPVFWWHGGDVLLAGSSPELFRHHPSFRFELDLAGLTGVLLTMYSLDGATLMSGVSRLGPGRALVWRKGSSPREVTQYQLPASTRHFDLPGSATADLVHETLKRSVARHVPSDSPSALTLTGGRDSRLLAGILSELGRPPVAVTLGNDNDIEVECAKSVAHALRLEHHVAGMNFDREVTCPELHARWLHCSTGFNSSDYWYCHENLRELPPFLVTGCVMGSIIGGSHFAWAYSEATQEMSFENFFARNNKLAIETGRLRKLLRPELFGTLVDDVVQQIRNTYESYSEFEAQRAWCFDLHHRQRFHVGVLPWQFSFGSWPVVPVVDKDVLSVTGGIPAGVLGGRRIQDEILRTYFPKLAELPLDRNGYNTTPLQPRLRYRVKANLASRIEPMMKKLGYRDCPGPERRFFYRLLDFNGPAWKMARQRAEPHRSKLYALFDKDALDSMLPAPEVDVGATDGILDASGMRLLVGLSLWAGEHL